MWWYKSAYCLVKRGEAFQQNIVAGAFDRVCIGLKLEIKI
jgi:hypothetical protein